MYTALTTAERYFQNASLTSIRSSAIQSNPAANAPVSTPNAQTGFSDFSNANAGLSKGIVNGKTILVVIGIVIGGALIYYSVYQYNQKRRRILEEKYMLT